MSRTGGPPVPDTTTVPSASVKTAAGVSSPETAWLRRTCHFTAPLVFKATIHQSKYPPRRRLAGDNQAAVRSLGNTRPGGASARRIGIRAPPAGTARPIVGDHGRENR